MPALPADGPGPSDEFLSEEDLDLANLSWPELCAWWDLWLEQAQISNDEDEDEYSHGVFAIPRREWPEAVREAGRASSKPGAD